MSLLTSPHQPPPAPPASSPPSPSAVPNDPQSPKQHKEPLSHRLNDFMASKPKMHCLRSLRRGVSVCVSKPALCLCLCVCTPVRELCGCYTVWVNNPKTCWAFLDGHDGYSIIITSVASNQSSVSNATSNKCPTFTHTVLSFCASLACFCRALPLPVDSMVCVLLTNSLFILSLHSSD